MGTLIYPHPVKNFPNCGEFVFITNSEIPHFTIAEEAAKEGWHVYEVVPHGKILMGMWDDGIVKSATVKRYVGTARGIQNRLKKNTNPRKPKTGSAVRLKPWAVETNSPSLARYLKIAFSPKDLPKNKKLLTYYL